MRYFLLSTVGDLNNRDLCLIDDPPKGMGLRRFLMSKGRPAREAYPAEARIFLREENPGIQLSSLLGNTENYLIVSTAVKQVFEQLCEGHDVEYLPFDLHDHRERLYSRDYFIINPIGALDCLDEAASGVTYGEEGSVVDIAEFVLDAGKLQQSPALFRIDKKPTKYVVDERFAQAAEAQGFTNVILTPLRVAGHT